MASSSNQNDDDDNLSNIQTTCQLAFHGAAANSCPHSLLWVRAPPPPPVIGGGASTSGDGDDGDGLVDTIIYASSGVINLATSHNCLSNNVTSVDKTLVTRTLDHCNGGMTEGKKVLARGEAAEDAAAPRSVTALSWVSNDGSGADGDTEESGLKKNGAFGMVAAFSDGTVTSWRYNKKNSTTDNCNWVEHVLIGHDPQPSTACERHYEEGMDKSNLQESIADISAASLNYTTGNDNGGSDWIVATASSKGIFLHISSVESVAENDSTINNNDDHQGTTTKQVVHSRQISCHAAASVQLQIRKNGNGGSNSDDVVREVYLFAGSASPRHNKVWVYTIPYSTNNGNGDISSSSDAPSTTWVALPTLTIGEPQYHGHLLGHQDWITCFAWLDNFAAINNGREEALLASSGHDAKIRLWKFSSWTSTERGGGSAVPMLEGEDEESGSDEDDNSDEDEANIDDLEEEQGEARLIIAHAEGNNITTTTAVSLEALLLGHEEAVTSLTWRGQRQSTTKSGNGGNNKPCLLSSSMDRTILLWMEEKDGVWVPISRVGSAGGILGGSIGASLMGFVDATFSPGSNRIVGHGYGGSIHFWTRQEVDSVPSNDKSLVNESLEEDVENEELELQDDDVAMEETARWVADPCITGHFRSVEDMAWDPNGEYLLTTSSDQTTRLWTEVPVSNNERGGDFRWVEAGRPQVHGYDMTSIVCIGGKSEDGSADGGGEPSHRFVSGADEKVLRVFDAPASTLRTLRMIKQARESASSGGIEEQPAEEERPGESQQPSSWRVERAFMPSLGLSNKATADVDQESSKFAGPTNNDEFDETLDSVIGGGSSSESVKLKLPSERDLGVTTLWPETRKLFGHESELVCLDAYCAPPSPAGEEEEPTLVASSCKARNDVASAAIRLWDAKKGKCVGILKGGHRSTVSTMSFSRDGKYLASSGKDRRICIWKRVNDSVSSTSDGPGPYELSAAADSAHKRIVWSVHFCPKRPDILASGSRDGLIKVWHVFEVADGGLEIQELLRFESISKAGKNPITAVTFAEETFKGKNGQVDYGILSIGTESGRIEVWAVPVTPAVDSNENGANHAPKLLCAIPSNDSHFDTVKRIAWRPNTNLTGARDEGSMNLTLASCGQDNGVRIFQLTVRKNEGT